MTGETEANVRQQASESGVRFSQEIKQVPRRARSARAELAIDGGRPAISRLLRERVPKWPLVSEQTGELLKQVYLSGEWSFNGKYEQQFCHEFARYHGAEYGVFMANGTVTLECILAALGVGAGDEVVVPALTWIATAMAVLYVGATPVFVDIESDTLCMDPEQLQKAITSRTKAIIPVHLYGSLANMDEIMALGNRYGIAVVEDAAHAHGAIRDGRGIGSIGRAGSFSFQQSKTLACGEAGICVTNDAGIAERLYRLKHIGYEAKMSQGKAQSGLPKGLLCHNYRATEFQALVLLENLKELRNQTELRERNARYLSDLLSDIEGVKIQARGVKADLQSFYTFVFFAELPGVRRVPLERLVEVLNAEGLGAHLTYGPVYTHALWNVAKHMYRFANGGCPVCEYVTRELAICIPQNWLLGDKELIDAIAGAIRKVVSNV